MKVSKQFVQITPDMQYYYLKVYIHYWQVVLKVNKSYIFLLKIVNLTQIILKQHLYHFLPHIRNITYRLTGGNLLMTFTLK